MNFPTALLDRLVPGRGSEDDADATPTEAQSEALPERDGDRSEQDAEPEIGRQRLTEEDVSDEDVILRQLIAHGGRVSRSTLAAETEWAEEELDDILREMEANAQISTIRRRDPLVCRRGFEPAGAPLRFKNG